MAAGANLGEKLFGMVKTIGPVFQSYAPGLGLLDLAIGVAGAVILYFVVQSKIKKARKFRRDMEYGSARWGTEADIKPFVDPKFENNVILTGTEFLTMNTRPKIPANARNLNACVIGSSGSGKTRFWLTPQLLQAHSSYVVVDPKGGTLSQCGYFLQKKKGYKVKVFNSIDFSKSMHYNPMAYIKTESDVLKFVNALIANTKGDGKEGDEFWTKAETLLYCALVAYIVFEGPEEERNMNTLVEMINSMEVREDDESFKNAVDYMFDGLAKRNPQHFAVRQYAKYKLASGNAALKFGEGLTCKNLIAYAPSVGKTAADECVPEYVIRGIKKFKKISARDDLTEQLVCNITGTAPERVLDPTFLAEFPRAELAAKKKPYILFYYCENLPHNILNQIFSYAKEHGLAVYGAGECDKRYSEITVNLMPFEWVEMFRNAEFVFTGTFHGAVFSILNRRQFKVYLTNESRIKKVTALLEELGIQNRKMDSKFEFDLESMKNEINYDAVYRVINEKRQSSKQYLKDAIGMAKQ